MQIEQKQVTNILEVLKASRKENQENEFRFGTFTETKFVPEVSKEEFDRVFNFIKSFSKYENTEDSYTMQFTDGSRSRTIIKSVSTNESSFFLFPWGSSIEVTSIINIKKINKKNIDITKYGLRFSSCEEEPSTKNRDNQRIDFLKVMKRFTFSFKYFKVDLSIFKVSKSEQSFDDSEVKYSIEVEICEIVSDISETMHFTENILKAIQNTSYLMESGEAETVLEHYSKLVKSEKYFGIKVLPLSDSTYKSYETYSVALKLDGLRAILFVFGNNVYHIDSRFKVSFTGIILGDANFNNCVFDCELFRGKYYLFDCIFFKGKDLREGSSMFLEKRLEFIKTFVSEAKNERLVEKEHHFGNHYLLATELTAKNLSNKDFDGLIFTPVNSSYPLKKKDPGVPLKWKPEELNTIDFLIKKGQVSEDHTIWELFVTDIQRKLVPFEVKDYPEIHKISVPTNISDNFFDQSVVECRFDKTSDSFVPLRPRHDKISPNYIGVAQSNFDLTITPYTFEKMNKMKKRDTTYFFNMRRFHNWIKRVLLDEYAIPNGNGGLLDLCCGKGGDIYKWGDNNIRYVEGYDICKDSVSEAKERYAKMVEKPIYKNMDYHFYHKDLSKSIIETERHFDTASCFFAVHYFFDSENSLVNLVKNTRNLKIGGHLILTCFDDTKLKAKDYNISTSKFKISRKNVDPSKLFGNSIDVFLEDTVLSEATTEFVINQSDFISRMSFQGFKLVQSKLFEEYYTEWSKNANYLDNTSKLFSFLNVALVFEKVGEYCDLPKKPVRAVREPIDFCALDTYTSEELQPKKVAELLDIAKTFGFTNKKYKKAELIEFILQKQ